MITFENALNFWAVFLPRKVVFPVLDAALCLKYVFSWSFKPKLKFSISLNSTEILMLYDYNPQFLFWVSTLNLNPWHSHYSRYTIYQGIQVFYTVDPFLHHFISPKALDYLQMFSVLIFLPVNICSYPEAVGMVSDIALSYIPKITPMLRRTKIKYRNLVLPNKYVLSIYVYNLGVLL